MPQHSTYYGSAYVLRYLQELPISTGLAIDIPSGKGRHTNALEQLGFRVVSADIDALALTHATYSNSAAMRVQLDGNCTLPFISNIFDLAIVIHPLTSGLLNTVPRVLRTGGYLIFETFSAHGDNWRALPRPNQIATLLADNFSTIDYIEKSARNHPSAVTVKAVFQKQ